MFVVELKNIDVKQIVNNVNINLRKTLYNDGKEMAGGSRGYIQRKMTEKPKSGRVSTVYVGIGGRRLKKARLHTASTRNEYPAVITGALRKNTGFRVHGSNMLEIYSQAPYARRMDARNRYLKRALNELHVKINHSLKIALKQGIENKKYV